MRTVATMSDHWEFYPCQMGDHQAFIFYDHGIRDEIDGRPFADALKIRVLLHSSTDAGLPTNDEFLRLSALEDLLSERVRELGGIYVGRVTVAGARYFHCFVSFKEGTAERMLRQLSGELGYELEFILEADPEKAYWEELFPTSREGQAVWDMKLLDVLKDHGDDPAVPRRVDHWLYFIEPSSRDALSIWALENGFMIQGFTDPEDADGGDYGIQIYHDARPDLQVITATTQLLWDKAEELGGSYDGWETSVETPPAGGAPNVAN